MPSSITPTTNDALPGDITEVEREEGLARIVQLRPALHALDLNIVRAASMTYPTLAPTVNHLNLALSRGICAYEMKYVSGTPLSRLQRRERSLDAGARQQLEHLITSFAGLMAQSWQSPHKVRSTSKGARADSPMDESPSILLQCRGKVGSTIIPRLERLSSELSDAHLRKIARDTIRAVQKIEDYPVILNHGDLIPSNILIDQNTWEITGLVDWAEAEYLPFGTCLYGLEHLLGYLSPALSGLEPTWTYYDGATQLRGLFWTRLVEAVPELGIRMEDLKMIRDVGVLLWHGIAWDDGAIDRVVNEVDDVEDMTKLRAFLTAGRELLREAPTVSA
jgi:hypothetical protein